ncbi:flagellar motor switch phosphatase FliY, partial [Paenibacillus odorifer]
MTSKDYLSQEEIDALLRQSAEGSLAPTEKTVDDYLTPFEQDALGEIGNITFGSAATALSTLLGKKVDITTPQVSIITRGEFEIAFPKPHVAVHVQYVDGFQGINSLVIKIRDAQVIADLMLGGAGEPQDEELNEIHISAVQEAMNQMMGSSATSMSTI